MKKTALLIMAAGIGSRYGGGVKQLASVDSMGHIIMDYSIHDAIEAGFNKIVFIIRRDIEADFKEVIGNRIETLCNSLGVEVEYCFQDIKDIPATFPEGRTKPWGTGHAVISAKEYIDMPFAVINADDYYGKKAFKLVHDWLVEDHLDSAVAMAGFILKNTLSENGGVTRGICVVEDGHSHVIDVLETRNIIKTPEGPSANGVAIDENSLVSMNMWGFPAAEGKAPAFMQVLTDNFDAFFKETVPGDPMKSEYLLPILIGNLLKKGTHTVKVLPTDDRWFGVTYKEDIDAVISDFKALISSGVYNEDLFSDLA